MGARATTADFTDANDITYSVVKALREWQNTRGQDLAAPSGGNPAPGPRPRDGGGPVPGARAGRETAPSAHEKVLTLLRAADRPNLVGGGSKLRVVLVPIDGPELINALTLRDGPLVDDVAAAARTSRLVSQSDGIQPEVGRDAIVLSLTTRGYETLALQVGFDGTVVGEGAVGSDDQFFASSVVVPDRARAVIAATLAFAEQTWQRIDKHGHVGDVVVASAVPEAEHKVYAIQPVGRQMRVPMSSPRLLLAPEEPLRFPRVMLPDATDRLDAELQRAFQLHGAINTGGGFR